MGWREEEGEGGGRRASDAGSVVCACLLASSRALREMAPGSLVFSAALAALSVSISWAGAELLGAL